jgi:hypothetical protein
MRTIKEILHTADGISEKPMQVIDESQVARLVDSARDVVATVFGNTDGMSLELQIEAIQTATSSLQAWLENFDI